MSNETEKRMIAFKNDPKLADKIRKQVQAHYDADEIIHGQYWQNGKGCAVGCIIHGSSHAKFETALGIPKELAHLLDGLFESLPNGDAKELPRRFVNAIKPGADLSMVIPHFLLWLLADEKDGVIRFAPEKTFPRQHSAIQGIIALFRQWIAGNKPGAAAWDAAWDAAGGAAWDAAWDAAGDAAWDAVGAAAAAARVAAWAAAGAARVAAWDAAWDARKRQAEKLIELLEAA